MEQPVSPGTEQPAIAASVPKAPYPITVNFEYSEKMSRLTTFFRVFMIIPHVIVLELLGIVAGLLMLASWFVILFTGKLPRGMFNFVAGYNRWSTRVNGYSSLLTDKYPPFSLD